MQFKQGFSLIEIVVVLVIISIISISTVYVFRGTRQANRDATRVANIGELQTALEQYYLVYKGYPPIITPGQALIGHNSNQVFMTKVPFNPQPVDGSTCPSTITYTYTVSGNTAVDGHSKESYKLDFCLGNRVGPWGAGANSAEPHRDTTCIPDCFMSCGAGSDGCNGTCSSTSTCPTDYTCQYDHCIKN